RSKIKVIAIGASTGGPMALEKILSLFPADFPSGIVVVQHMAKGFIESFADWLGTKTPLKIKIGEDGEAIKNGTVYFAPDDVQLEINPDCTLRLNKHAPFWGEFKPSVNNLFKSVGENLGCKSIGVILTGMGSDGAEGMTTLYKKGAYTIAQNQETSLIFGMPKASIENRCISSVLPLRDIPDAIALKMTE
ncbi:MAG: chemotaxis protein CheB, partial [bacterium]|nr:chemotaxis protein CheB [bacterium]